MLVDPPYEETGELPRLVAELRRAVSKWPTGIYAAWYPIKDPAEIEPVATALGEAIARPAVRLELMIDRVDDVARLNGSGLFVINPPWRLADEAGVILPALAERLSRGGYGAYRCHAIGGKGAPS